MPKFNVHVYAVVRVRVAGVEADSPSAAAKQADESLDLHTIFNGLKSPQADRIEYADEIQDFMVDPLNDAGERIADGININADYTIQNPTAPTAQTVEKVCILFSDVDRTQHVELQREDDTTALVIYTENHAHFVCLSPRDCGEIYENREEDKYIVVDAPELTDDVIREQLKILTKATGVKYALVKGDQSTCDECGAVSSDENFGIGMWHDESCSLHPKNIV